MQWAAWEARAGCPVGGDPEEATWEPSVREELALEGPGAGAGRNRLVLRTQGVPVTAATRRRFSPFS